MPSHRDCAKNGRTSLVYQKIRERGDFQYELLESIFCQDFDEARRHEKRWSRRLKANLNMISPLLTKEERKEYEKEYECRPEVKARKKKYQQTEKYKTQRRDYLNKPETREHTQTQQAKYWVEYKTRPGVQKKSKENITCDCGSTVRLLNISHHKKTKKHQNFIASQK